MANSKRDRQNERQRVRNKAVRSEIKTRIKSANSEATVRLAVQRLDKAAAQGVIHKNQASNRKSGLMRQSPNG